MFFIAMPLFYITTYLILGSKEALWANSIATTLIWLVFGVICSVFFARTAQSPGYKFAKIYLIDTNTGRKISFFHAFLRFLCFVLAGFCIFGLLLCFFRKDRLNLHDILTHTAPVQRSENG